MTPLYAYIHGFGSSAQSNKGQELKRRFTAAGKKFDCPELNRPSFSTQTITANLAYLDTFDQQMQQQHGDFRWKLIASSMGGYLAATWASLRPERVESLLLLCPAFNMHTRWSTALGETAMKRWQDVGHFTFPGPKKTPEPLHWKFMQDMQEHPSRPAFSCPAQIIHGIQDTVVPIESSRSYVQEHPHIRLHEVQDEHPLALSMTTIWRVCQDFLL